MLNMALKGAQKGFKLNKMPNWHLHCIHCIFCKICEGIIHITPVLRSLSRRTLSLRASLSYTSRPCLNKQNSLSNTKFSVATWKKKEFITKICMYNLGVNQYLEKSQKENVKPNKWFLFSTQFIVCTFYGSDYLYYIYMYIYNKNIFMALFISLFPM